MIFGNFRNSVVREINIASQNQETKRMESHKYRGVRSDFNMKWDIYIKYVINKTRYLLYEELRDIFLNNTSKTGNKCIQLPKSKKYIIDKNSSVVFQHYTK